MSTIYVATQMVHLTAPLTVASGWAGLQGATHPPLQSELTTAFSWPGVASCTTQKRHTSSEVPERASRPPGVLARDSGAMSSTSSSSEPWMNSISSCNVATCRTRDGQYPWTCDRYGAFPLYVASPLPGSCRAAQWPPVVAEVKQNTGMNVPAKNVRVRCRAPTLLQHAIDALDLQLQRGHHLNMFCVRC